MADHHKIVPAKHYVFNFAALTVLMILTVVASRFHFGVMNFPIALGIAITKAVLIVLIFMDVRNGSHLTWIFAGAGFFFLLIMISFTMTDFVVHESGTLGASPYVHPAPGTFDEPAPIIPPAGHNTPAAH